MTAITGPFAADRIVDALETINVEPDFYPEKAVEPVGANAAQAVAGQSHSLRSFLHNLRNRNAESKLSRAEKIQLAYARQKFPGISLEDVQTRIYRLREITNRFSTIQVYQHGSNSYCILPE